MKDFQKEKAPFLPTRKSLVERLRSWDDQESWKQVYDTYWQLIYGVGRRAGLHHSEAEDLVQEIVVAVAQKMPEFQYDRERCTFKGWLMLITRSRLANLIRNTNRRLPRAENLKDVDDEERVLDPSESASPEIETIWEEEWRKNLMEQAIRSIKSKVPIEQYQMFDLNVLKEIDGRKVSKMLGVSLSRVYVTKHRLSKLIREEVRRLEDATEK